MRTDQLTYQGFARKLRNLYTKFVRPSKHLVAGEANSIIKSDAFGDWAETGVAENSLVGRLQSEVEDIEVPAQSFVGRQDVDVGSFVVNTNSFVGRANANLRGIGVDTNEIVGRQGSFLQGIPFTTNSVLARGVGNFLPISLPNYSILANKDALTNVQALTAGTSSNGSGRVLAKYTDGATTEMDFVGSGALLKDVLKTALAGTSFPTGNLFDGRTFYRTDLGESFTYGTFGADTGWLGNRTYNIEGNEASAQSATLEHFIGQSAGLRYGVGTGTKAGYQFGFQTKCIGMQAWAFASSTFTTTLRDYTTGANVTSASISLAAATGGETDGTFGNKVAANKVLGLRLSSGTINGGTIRATIARFEDA